MLPMPPTDDAGTAADGARAVSRWSCWWKPHVSCRMIAAAMPRSARISNTKSRSGKITPFPLPPVPPRGGTREKAGEIVVRREPYTHIRMLPSLIPLTSCSVPLRLCKVAMEFAPDGARRPNYPFAGLMTPVRAYCRRKGMTEVYRTGNDRQRPRLP